MMFYFLALIVLFGLGAVFLYKYQGKKAFQALYQVERQRAEALAREITTQRQEEEALRESGDRYRQVVKNANEAIFVVQDQTIKFFNPKAKEIYGYTDETTPAVFSFIEAIHPEDRGMVLERYQKRLKGEELPHVYPFRIIDRQGKVKWVEINSVLISWAGRPATLIFLNDISERKRTEEKILLAKEEWERTFDSIPDLIAIVDNEFRIMRVNRAMADRLSLTPKEMIGGYCYELIHGLPTPPSSCLKQQDILEGREFSAEFYEPRLGGHFLLTTSLLCGVGDDSSGVIHVFRDISDRKQAEEKIIEGAKKLQKIMDGIIEAMALTVEARDPHTAGHQRRVADLAREMAKELKFPLDRIEGIHMAGMIHDLGKMSVPAEILSKTTPLTLIEFGLIKIHPQAGYEILKGIDFPWPVALMIFQHHERIDGSGYPQGLRNEEILLEARILAVADVVEAIASHRPYRPALGIDAALEEIEKNRGRLYDPLVVDTCLELFRIKKYTLV